MAAGAAEWAEDGRCPAGQAAVCELQPLQCWLVTLGPPDVHQDSLHAGGQRWRCWSNHGRSNQAALPPEAQCNAAVRRQRHRATYLVLASRLPLPAQIRVTCSLDRSGELGLPLMCCSVSIGLMAAAAPPAAQQMRFGAAETAPMHMHL